jgi:hypothetical protein
MPKNNRDKIKTQKSKNGRTDFSLIFNGRAATATVRELYKLVDGKSYINQDLR